MISLKKVTLKVDDSKVNTNEISISYQTNDSHFGMHSARPIQCPSGPHTRQFAVHPAGMKPSRHRNKAL